MRTNIVLDDDLVAEAQSLTGTKTKRALVEQALATLIRVKRGESQAQRYRERLLEVRRQLEDSGSGSFGSHDLLRRDRDSR